MFSRLALATFPFLMPLQQTSVSKRRQPVALLHVATLDRRQTIRCPDLGGGAGGATAKLWGAVGGGLASAHAMRCPTHAQPSTAVLVAVLDTCNINTQEKGLGGRPADFCCLRRCGGRTERWHQSQHEDHWGCGVVCGWWTAHVNTSFEEPSNGVITGLRLQLSPTTKQHTVQNKEVHE